MKHLLMATIVLLAAISGATTASAAEPFASACTSATNSDCQGDACVGVAHWVPQCVDAPIDIKRRERASNTSFPQAISLFLSRRLADWDTP